MQAARQQRDLAVAQLLKLAALRPPHRDNPARVPEVCCVWPNCGAACDPVVMRQAGCHAYVRPLDSKVVARLQYSCRCMALLGVSMLIVLLILHIYWLLATCCCLRPFYRRCQLMVVL